LVGNSTNMMSSYRLQSITSVAVSNASKGA